MDPPRIAWDPSGSLADERKP